MGVISMAYFLAFVVGVGPGSIAIKLWGWRSVFVALAAVSVAILAIVLTSLPRDKGRTAVRFSAASLASHFRKSDRLAGMVAAFLTSGGLVGSDVLCRWLQTGKGISIEKSDSHHGSGNRCGIGARRCRDGCRITRGKRKSSWGEPDPRPRFPLALHDSTGAGLVGDDGNPEHLCFRTPGSAPCHHDGDRGAEIRGEYTAVRNASSQLGIAVAATLSAYAFDSYGFSGVSNLAALMTLMIPSVFLAPRVIFFAGEKAMKSLIKVAILTSVTTAALVYVLLEWRPLGDIRSSPLVTWASSSSSSASSSSTASPLPGPKGGRVPISEDELNNIEVYQKTNTGVVNITSASVAYDIFSRPIPQSGVGSGVIIDDLGHIVTNHHVIQDADQLEVTLADKSTTRKIMVRSQ
jgi:hypothetical protein